MRILLTGGTGSAGAHTVAAPMAAGHHIRLRVGSPVGNGSPSALASERAVIRAWLWRRRRTRRGGRDRAQANLRRARTDLTIAFGLAGALCGVFTARIPTLMDKLAISPAQFACRSYVGRRSQRVRSAMMTWLLLMVGDLSGRSAVG